MSKAAQNRCKDCAYWVEESGDQQPHYCGVLGVYVRPMEFCREGAWTKRE